MRSVIAGLILILLLGANSSCSTAPPPPPRAASDLDGLFRRLQSTADADEAKVIEVTILHVWSHSGRSAVDAQMEEAVQAVQGGETERALAILDQVVKAAPDFAEGWNLRAAVHYLRDEYPPAVRDIERVLRLEPRHFGALAGLGRILHEMDEDRAALRAFDAALSLNPHLDEVRQQAEELRDHLSGIPI